MTRWTKIIASIRKNPRNVRFSDLCVLAERAGFELVRTRGSHRIYRRPGLPLVNLQEDGGGKAKAYQVQQLLRLIDDNDLEIDP